jgi:hypothetical protein
VADEDEHEATLEAYEHAKREQLHNEGVAPLRRELAALTRFLESDDVTPQLTNVDVDEGFREAKAEILRDLIAEAQAGDD